MLLLCVDGREHRWQWVIAMQPYHKAMDYFSVSSFPIAYIHHISPLTTSKTHRVCRLGSVHDIAGCRRCCRWRCHCSLDGSRESTGCLVCWRRLLNGCANPPDWALTNSWAASKQWRALSTRLSSPPKYRDRCACQPWAIQNISGWATAAAVNLTYNLSPVTWSTGLVKKRGPFGQCQSSGIIRNSNSGNRIGWKHPSQCDATPDLWCPRLLMAMGDALATVTIGTSLSCDKISLKTNHKDKWSERRELIWNEA